MKLSMRINKFMKKYSIPCMWAAGVFSLAGIILSKLPINPWFANGVYLVAMVLAGTPILVRAIQGLRYKSIGIECLVSIAVIGACVIQEFSEAAIVTFLFQFGSYLEQRTMKKTRSAIKTLTEMAPTTAWRLDGDEAEEVDVDEVETGDCLLVKTGNQIAVDGIVTEGDGYVNEASITGESTLCKKETGSLVYAGTILDSGMIKMQATKVGEDTTFSKIIALVEEAQDAKSPAERFIDKFARYYTPVVVLLAAVTLLITRNLDTAITVLVLACPGALVIGAPIANVAGIGRGAQEGVLLKGGDSVNTFAKTNVFVFDKTGTLTVGQPVVTECFFLTEQADEQQTNEQQILALAASIEQASEHPLAQAVVKYAKEQGVPLRQIMDVEEEKGYGIRAKEDDREILVGNRKLLEKYEVTNLSLAEEKEELIHSKGGTIVLLAVDKKVVLVLGIADAIKKDAVAGIQKLKKQKVQRLVMLTGDHAGTAELVAGQIGITEFHGELLPEDKLEYIKKLKEEGHRVTFVGDGINDSPALATADTGIAMGSGTDVAIDSSDVILIKSDIVSLATGYGLAKRIVRIMYQNIAIAIGTVILLLAGLFAGYIHMAIGMLIHEASILVVILNAMRLLMHDRRK